MSGSTRTGKRCLAVCQNTVIPQLLDQCSYFRMSGLWGYQSALDLYLQENGITTLLFGGVNADQVLFSSMIILQANATRWQCVGGTLVDAYFRGYDCVLVSDITATTSPAGGLENVFHNAANVSITCRVKLLTHMHLIDSLMDF